jgi:hypothetical protein
MLIQAVSLAVLAALSPTAVLVSAAFLSLTNPHRAVLSYLAGAIVMTAIFAAVLFVALRAGHLQVPKRHEPRYGLRLGLGLLMLVACAILRRRGPRQPDPAKKDKGVIHRLLRRPGVATAFIIGLLVYSPSLTFIAAVQVVATANASVPGSVLAIVLVIVITVMFVWLPFVLYLLAPERTALLLRRSDRWLRSHGYLLAVAGLGIGGTVLVVNGLLGLTGVLP